MKITTLLRKIAGDSTVLRVFMRTLRAVILKLRYKLRGLFVRTDGRLVVFSAYNGKSYACSPRAVYEKMLNDPRFSEFRFVWLFDDPEAHRDLEKNRATFVIKNRSRECEAALIKAGYWIFNFRAYDHWLPRRTQTYVQCWHGTPLKRLGYDITRSDNAMNSIAEIRSKYRSDAKRFSYLLSSCPFVTEKFSSAWALDRFAKSGTILETGYPRNDFLRSFTTEDAKAVREKLGLSDCDKKLILYAPTWRDNRYDASRGYVYDCPVDFNYLKRELSDEYIILFRAHYLVASSFDFDAYKGFILNVSDWDDINELYIIADMLITDYSSVFFDYAILRRPMLFYMYDMEAYRDELRGFYLELSELPGPIVTTERELAEAVRTAKTDAKQLDRFNAAYNSLNDGKAAERLTDKIFGETEI